MSSSFAVFIAFAGSGGSRTDMQPLASIISSRNHPEHVSDYDRMVYCCLTCNGIRQDSWLPVDPTREALGNHLETDESGEVNAKSDRGSQMIKTFQLDRDALTEYRREMMKLLLELASSESSDAIESLQHLLSYPSDLPDLTRKQPPDNHRKAGLQSTAFVLREKGELPEWY